MHNQRKIGLVNQSMISAWDIMPLTLAWDSCVRLRLLLSPHQRPCAAMNTLRSLGALGLRVSPEQLEALCWLLDITGSRRVRPGDAVDKGVRCRACAVLDGFLRGLSRQGFAKLPKELQACCMSVLLARCSDRCSDVRQVASEALSTLGGLDKETSEVLRQRALSDCNECVRAACVSALLQGNHADTALEIISASSLDLAPRVRRRVLESMDLKKLQGDPESPLAAAWRKAVLQGLGDRLRSVRLAAVRCLVADVQQLGDRALCLTDVDFAAGVGSACSHSGIQVIPQAKAWIWGLASTTLASWKGATSRIVCGVAGVVRQPNNIDAEGEGSSRALRELLRCFDVDKSLENASVAEATKGQVLWARITLHLATVLGEASPTEEMVQEIQKCMAMLHESSSGPKIKDEAHFKLCQWLNCALVCDMPAESAGREQLVQVAGAALKVSPLQHTVKALLEDGIFPGSFLGDEWSSDPPSFELATLLLRRVIADGSTFDVNGPKAASAAEVLFSSFAAAIFNNLGKERDAANEKLLEAQDELKQMEKDLEDQRWAEAAPSWIKTGKGSTAEHKAIEDMGEDIEALREEHHQCCLRALLLATAWLRYSRCPLQRDSKQRQLLHTVLLPVVSDPVQPVYNKVAAIHGIAIYASKSEEYALSLWDFFVKLLEEQDLEQLNSLRITELCVLFICDSLLHLAAREKRQNASVILARTVMSVEEKTAQSGRAALHHLRAVLWDRVCCLALQGMLEGASGTWLLGKALEVVCRSSGKGSEGEKRSCRKNQKRHMHDAYTSLGYQSEAKSPGESILGSASQLLDVGDDPIRRAVLRSRLMRFFACLPKVSAEHAALLLQAVEAFFGARLYCAHLSGPEKEAKEASKSCAVGAVRLVCHYLGKAKESLASHRCDAAELQLNVIKQTAAAYLSAPCAEAKGLAHALGTAILASANGGPCFDWAGKNADKLRDAARSLLRDWSPATSAKTTTLLLQEIHYAGQVPAETGREFAQEALDSAADFRHDLAVLGLTPIANPGVRGPTKTLYVPNPRVGYWRKPEPVTQKPRQLPDQMEEEEEEWEEPSPEMVSRWEILDRRGARLALVPRGSGLTLGRHRGCDICVDTSSVSARHCLITCLTGSKRDSLILRDLSSNGTFVNGIHLKDGEELGLSHGDVITLATRDGQAFEVRQCQVKKGEDHMKPEEKRQAAADSQAVPAGQVSGVKRPAETPKDQSAPSRRLRRKTKDPNWVAEAAKSQNHQEPTVEEVAVAVLHAKGNGQGPRLVDLTSGEVYHLPEEGCVSIGRRADCEVVIPRAVVSGRHCVLTCSPDGVQVEELQGLRLAADSVCLGQDESSNGTFVNEIQVPKGFSLPQRIPLRDGDHIYLASRDGPGLLFLTGEDDEDDEED
eukprot:s1127_g21.t1